MILSLMIFAPIIGAVLVYLVGLRSEKASKVLAVAISALDSNSYALHFSLHSTGLR